MVSRRSIKSLFVLMNGVLVGSLLKSQNGALSFSYTDEWLVSPNSRPLSLSLPLQKSVHDGQQVYNFFDNLLPDNDRIRARIQARFQVQSRQPFDLLAAIGIDCVGAIQLCAEDAQPNRIDVVTAEPLSDAQIASLLRGYELAPLGMSKEIDDFRISIAGAQEKTALLWFENRWCRPMGTTPTSHIFKLPIGRVSHNQIDLSNSCENEWLCLQIAKAFDLPTPPAVIKCFEDVKVLIVQRFDRQWSSDSCWLMRLPQEDFCQALGVAPSLKYQSDGGPTIVDLMTLLLGSVTAEADREAFFRSQILFWILAATDAHAKNFSIFLEAGSRFRLTPFYDILSAYPLIYSKALSPQRAKMAMALKGKGNHYLWSAIQPRHFISTARAVGFNSIKAEQIVWEMLENVAAISNQVAMSLPPDFPSHVSEPIFEGMESLARSHLTTRTALKEER